MWKANTRLEILIACSREEFLLRRCFLKVGLCGYKTVSTIMSLRGNCSNAVEVVIFKSCLLFENEYMFVFIHSFLFKVYYIHIELTFLRITYMEQVPKMVHLEYTNLAGAL